MMRPRALRALLATTASRSTGSATLRPRLLLASGLASSGAQTPPLPHARQLDLLASKGESKAVLEGYQRLTQQPDFVPSARAENARLRALLQEQLYEEVTQAVQRWRPTEPRTLRTYHQAIMACARLKDLERALRFFAEAKCTVPGGVTTATYNLVLDAMAKAGQPQRALQLLEELEAAPGLRADVVSYGTCINAFAQQGDFQQGLRLLEWMEAGNVQGETAGHPSLHPNDYIWAALLDACRRAGRLDAALEMWERYIQWQALPATPSPLPFNAILLNTLIGMCGQMGEWQQGLRLLEENEDRLPPGSRMNGCDSRTVLYHTTINACGRAGQWQVGVKLLQERLLAPSPPRPAAEPDAAVFAAAMSNCVHARQWGAVQRLYEIMTEEARVPPNVSVCNLVITSYRWSDGRWAEMLAFLRAMPCKPNAGTYIQALDVLAYFERHAEARALYDELPRSSTCAPESPLVRSTRLASEVLLAYANAERGEDALAFLEEMESDGLMPSALCYVRAALACGRAGMVGEAQRLLQKLRARWPRKFPNGRQLQREMGEERWAEVARLATAFAEAVDSEDVESGPASLVAAMSVLCSVGDWEGAIRLLPQFDRREMVPNEVVRASLLTTVVGAGQWPLAFYLMEQWACLRRPGLGSSFAALVDALVEGADGARVDEGALVVRLFGPTLYRSLHARGLISHRHREETFLPDTLTADLHTQGKVQSVCAVLALLEEMREHYCAALTPGAAEQAIKALVLVVGKGKRNKLRVSVLGPYLLDALNRVTGPAFFQPPLRAGHPRNNPGRIVVPRDEVRRYIKAALKKE